MVTVDVVPSHLARSAGCRAGECRDAARSIGRSGIVAASIIAMFVLGTSSVVALVPRGQIDLISPISRR